MDLIGKEIKHRIFGTGTVADLSEGIITVRFGENDKSFVYPDAFAGYLSLNDRIIQQYVDKQIEDKEIITRKKENARRAERNRRRNLFSLKITPDSHIVFNIPEGMTERVIEANQVSTGTYLSGQSKGKPRVAGRIKPNSVCLLTERPAGISEQERRIVGAFIVREDCFGKDIEDGIIEGHPKHRVRLPKDSPLMFWKYVDDDTHLRWGNTAFKYCSDDAVNRILSDTAKILASTEQAQAAAEFYTYFCRLNRISPIVRPEKTV